MRAEVHAAFPSFTAKFEGRVPYMYLDIKGYVTCAYGNLIDPLDMALDVPFVRKDGQPATQDDIIDDWNRVKARTQATTHPNPKSGGGAFSSVAQLRLTDDGLEFVLMRALAHMDRELAKHYPMFEAWPADAQLATLSMAWACGPAFHQLFPKLATALRTQDFATAANECHIQSTGNPGIVPRNIANAHLFKNAAFLHEHPTYSLDALYYPRRLSVEFVAPTPPNAIPAAIPYDDKVEGVLEANEEARRRDREPK